MKGKGEVSETMLNEKEASKLSDNEFNKLVTKKLHELTQNYQNYKENTMNSLKSILTRKGNRNYQQGPRRNEEYNF